MTLAASQPSTLDLIPGARNAVSYLLGKVAEFQRVPQRLSVAQTNLINVKRAAETRSKMGYATEAAIAIQQVSGLQEQYQSASDSVANALDQLRTSGMLAGPLDVASAVVDAGGRVASILNGTKQVEDTAKSLAGKIGLPGDQQARTSHSISITQGLLMAGLLYVGLWALRKSGGTRRWD